MSRQSFYLLRFPGRDVRRSSDAHDAQYALSEIRRNDTFRNSRYHFQQEFAEEEKGQAQGEQAREEEFDHMMDGSKNTFETNQQRRERSFLETDARQEESFQKNEVPRDAVFLDGQNSRAAAFESDQAIHAKHAEWCKSARETLLLQGREGRKDACAAIDAALVDQLHLLLKTQADSFVSEEHRRDSMVKKLLDDERALISSLIGNDGANIRPSILFPEATNSDPRPYEALATANFASRRASRSRTRGRSRSPLMIRQPSSQNKDIPLRRSSRSRRRSRTRSPSIIRRQRSPSPDESTRSFRRRRPRSQSSYDEVPLPSPHDISPTIRRPRSPSSDGLTRGPPPRPRSFYDEVPLPAPPDLSPTLNDSKGRESDRTDPPQNIRDQFEKRFSDAQQERLQSFFDDERQREDRFQAAEAAWEEAEAERTEIYEQREQEYSTKSQAMLQSHAEHFRVKEAVRARQTARREGVFDAAQERQTHTFNRSLAHIETQAEAAGSLEEDITNRMKSTTKSLSKRQIAQLKAAREGYSAQFKEAQRRRDAELGVSTLALQPHTIPKRRYHSVSYIRNYSLPLPMAASYEEVGMLPLQQVYRDRSPPLPRLVRPLSPPAGFAVGTLFRGANVRDPLPVLGLDERPTEAVRQEMSFQKFQRRRQHIFERSEVGRQETFGRAMQRRRQTFSANEARRQTEFRKKQRERKATSAEKENEREDLFMRAQRQREANFQAAEEGREVEFRRDEGARDRAFYEAQAQRAARFYMTQGELQKKCFEDEQRRSSDLETWGAQLLQEREREQMEEYRNEEEAREDAFKRSLGAYVSKRVASH